MGRVVFLISAALQRIVVLIGTVAIVGQTAFAADLPRHDPLRILIVSDEVNPHGLSDDELTQPGDLSNALSQHGTGLNISHSLDSILEIPTNSIEQATAALSVSFCDPNAYDVLIYFSHRIPNNGSAANNSARQEAFTVAVEDFLIAGGGMISFHHGSYVTGGKQSIQSVIGASAYGSVPWDTVDGQNVINVSPSHFITSNSVEYTNIVNYSDLGNGVPSGFYRSFNNTPDERYLNFDINNDAGEIEVLFGSNYSQSGSSHLLGFTHKRPQWKGIVVGYQPGEYQPNALDDLEGNNFQILANAIVYVSSFAEPSADLNADGTVNVDDLLILLNAWGMCPHSTDCCLADLDEDGIVGTSDIIILFGQWG